MGLLVTATAVVSCTSGTVPGTLSVPPGPVLCGGKPVATIQAVVPQLNIPPFGMCMSPNNPMVAQATAAAMGVLTPVPCVPVTPAPWAPGSPTVLVSGQPALTQSSKCACTWGGNIQIGFPGQQNTQVAD
ncbi:hypothetical protein SGFS_067960 [Streptomyces graminofaciens]|uniref:DUF4280 domain-containing protein n=1 Tax=Streptomyces graminofaciens TaxID=68212 RepID=A0ABN5VPV7_9ACTN|nr:DUF4280 domain-containing protein [Streptomyces graminofaciens]BBC35502.1 hypothetical protein SGFS_067960 [Streptomyces graminofaciens]